MGRRPATRRILGALAVALIGLLGVHLWNRRVGLIAMAIAAVYVPWITLGGSLMSEPLFVLLMLGGLLLASKGPANFAVAAGVAGLAVLTRANGLILFVPLALDRVGTAPVGRSARPPCWSRWRCSTVAPWTVRNAVELHAFVPVTTQFGTALAGTYNDEARDRSRGPRPRGGRCGASRRTGR